VWVSLAEAGKAPYNLLLVHRFWLMEEQSGLFLTIIVGEMEQVFFLKMDFWVRNV
jgi:hypothetical protein